MTIVNSNAKSTIANYVTVSHSTKEKTRDLNIAIYVAMHSAIKSMDRLCNLLNDLSIKKNSTFKNLRLHWTKLSLW